MQITAKELCQLLNGTLEGNPDVKVNAPSKIEEGKEGTISFLANPKYEQYAYTTKSSILLVSKTFKPSKPISATLIRVEDVYASLAELMERFGQGPEETRGIDETASVDDSVEVGAAVRIGQYSVVEAGAKIGKGCRIYPQVYIGEKVELGENVTLYPGVKIYADCKVGANSILHANVVIGSDGFGFAPEADGSYRKIPQLGNVVIEESVEIGANTVIDRATMGSTVIRKGVKLDNLIQIAHNVEIGEHTAIAAQAGIAGSTRIGKRCLIGGQAGFVGHIELADGVKVQAQSGVAGSVKTPGAAIYGAPAIPYADFLRSYAVFKQLPALYKQLNDLEKELKAYKEK